MAVQRICAQCGMPFNALRERNKFCSKTCYHRALGEPKVQLTCARCGRLFLSSASDRDRQFCSSTCHYEHRKTPNKVIDYGTHLGLELIDGSGRCVGIALIDREDYENVKSYRWVMSRRGRQAGQVAAMFRDRTGKYKGVSLHRIVLDPPDGMVVDHRSHDRLDNRKSNLRVATYSQNAVNRTPKKRDLPLGITYRAECTRRPFVACIEYRGQKRQARFATLAEALSTRRQWEKELHGEWAYSESIRQGPRTAAYASTMDVGGTTTHVTTIIQSPRE